MTEEEMVTQANIPWLTWYNEADKTKERDPISTKSIEEKPLSRCVKVALTQKKYDDISAAIKKFEIVLDISNLETMQHSGVLKYRAVFLLFKYILEGFNQDESVHMSANLLWLKKALKEARAKAIVGWSKQFMN
ncbi:hypothetical protein BDB01DRAFT_831391 [Pilobolus umbonatus]|nr:hypothetical protein BDB01DRAFT_831391 [Pilobolus umbonatus]